MLTVFAGLTRTPLRCALPPSTASAASERVLKKRAAHSHLSIRSRSAPLSFVELFIKIFHRKGRKGTQGKTLNQTGLIVFLREPLRPLR